MSKQNLLILSIVSIALVVGGDILGATKSPGNIIYIVGGVVSLVTWILGIVKTAQLRRWGWMVEAILLGTLGTLIYSIAGPDSPKVGA